MRGYVDPGRNKMAESIQDAIRKCGGRDGTILDVVREVDEYRFKD